MSDYDSLPQAVRAEALESLLIEKGLLTEADIDETIALYNDRVGPMNGARVVVRAWTDSDFRQRLLDDATTAIEEFGFTGGEVQKLVAVENTDKVHNVVVCTLCSCYPWAVLGLPPKWYKDPAYRSRVVREPRAVLKDFGLDLGTEKEIRVWDSSAEVRYMVLPQPPADFDPGDFSDPSADRTRLAERVTRDSMIGVAIL